MRWFPGRGNDGEPDPPGGANDSGASDFEDDALSDEDHLAYELHEWAGETRLVLDQLLAVRGVARVWQGATLVVRASDEEEVDTAVEEAEAAGNPTLDPNAEKVVYETTGWGADEQTAFSELLGRLGVAHEFDDQADLVVEATDEEAVETALDTFQVMLDQRPELEGLDANGLLTGVFVACDRLRRDPYDDTGVGDIVRLAPILVGHRPPFGFAAGLWDDLGRRIGELVDLLVEGDTDESALGKRAADLAELLRTLV